MPDQLAIALDALRRIDRGDDGAQAIANVALLKIAAEAEADERLDISEPLPPPP